MKKIWNFILKNRLYILIVIIVALGVVVFLTFKSFMYPENESSVYGDRLDGIEEVTITDTKKNEVISKIKEEKDITSVSIDIQGKIINITIKATTEDNTLEVMEALGAKIIGYFSDKEVAFYDIQFFIQNKDANYNLIGYKNKKNTDITWESDVIVSEVENNEEEAQ